MSIMKYSRYSKTYIDKNIIVYQYAIECRPISSSVNRYLLLLENCYGYKLYSFRKMVQVLFEGVINSY